jgi:hypothetical protein
MVCEFIGVQREIPDGLRSAGTSALPRVESLGVSEQTGDKKREPNRRRAYDNRHYVRPAVAHNMVL